MGILAGLIIQWFIAFGCMGYAESAVWKFTDLENPTFTLGKIVSETLDIKVAAGTEKSFALKTRGLLALAIVLPLSLLLWLGMRRQEA